MTRSFLHPALAGVGRNVSRLREAPLPPLHRRARSTNERFDGLDRTSTIPINDEGL